MSKIPPDQFRYYSPRDYELTELSRKRWASLRARVRSWVRFLFRI